METAKSPKILITGATGNIGKELTQYLSGKGTPFRAMVRSLDKVNAEYQLNAEYVTGDFNDALSLQSSLTGIEKAFLLTNSSELAEAQQLRFVELAVKAGVKHIVKLSQWAADLHSPVRFLRYHAAVEQAIIESGVKYTFLRPNLFMQGLLEFRDTIRYQDQFFGAIGEAKVSVVDTRDIAAAAGEALTSAAHENRIYNLTGPEALSHYEMAAQLSEAAGRNIRFVDIPSEALRDMLRHVGLPDWQAEGLIEDYAHYKRGEAASIETGVREATGQEPRSFNAFAADYTALFAK
ncbi:SDR family oxidoreductase [Dyadobacter sp. Leaf189]|uniref:SDR family oxidoreductase n=1 Tax=Dyadobacter sp. Leaf189 TaxID=1736295 RepID=UPI0006F33D44|nr:SDR family oxidoreductase [Dyadobacter sp. Leaf189]KQS34043.1 NAD(P)-dependent oxidoreductase [Dyadobacter sp. Leaf189]